MLPQETIDRIDTEGYVATLEHEHKINRLELKPNLTLLDSFYTGYRKGAMKEAVRSQDLVKALEEIRNMKRQPGETSDTYSFNRCWNIAVDALIQYETPAAG